MKPSLLVCALLALPLPALADPPAGQIDPTFDGFGVGIPGLHLENFNLGGDWHDAAYAMIEDAQGRLLLAGAAQTDGGQCLGLMRFMPDGQLDADGFGFDENNVAKGKICHAVLAPDVELGNDLDIALLPDGGFLVGGIANHQAPFVCRFHADGRLRTDFAGGCVSLAEIVGASWPAPDLLVAGTTLFVVANNHLDEDLLVPVLSRVALQTGDLLPFGQEPFVPLLSSEANAFAWDAKLTDDGALMLVGQIIEDADDLDAFVARFDLQQLQPDLAFSGDGMARFKFNLTPLGQDYLTAVTMLPNGNVLAAGMIQIQMPDRYGLALVELDPGTGAPSPDFDGGSPKTYDPCAALDGGCHVMVNEVAATSDHIIVAGRASNAMFAVRLDRSGAVDHGFGDAGLVRFDFSPEATGLALQDERIVLAGPSYSGLTGDSDFALLRLSGGRLFSDQFESAAP